MSVNVMCEVRMNSVNVMPGYHMWGSTAQAHQGATSKLLAKCTQRYRIGKIWQTHTTLTHLQNFGKTHTTLAQLHSSGKMHARLAHWPKSGRSARKISALANSGKTHATVVPSSSDKLHGRVSSPGLTAELPYTDTTPGHLIYCGFDMLMGTTKGVNQHPSTS